MHRPFLIIASSRGALPTPRVARSSFRALPLLVASCATQVAHADAPTASVPALAAPTKAASVISKPAASAFTGSKPIPAAPAKTALPKTAPAVSVPTVSATTVSPPAASTSAVSMAALPPQIQKAVAASGTRPARAKTLIAQSPGAQLPARPLDESKPSRTLLASQPQMPSLLVEVSMVSAGEQDPPVGGQNNQGNSNKPAATPKDQPRGIQVPVGPEKKDDKTPPQPAPPTPDTTPPTTPTQPALPPGSQIDTRPTVNPFIGDVTAAEGREITSVSVVGNRVVPTDTILTSIRTQRSAPFSSRVADQDRGRIDGLGFFATVQVQVLPDVNDPSKVAVTYIVTENRVVTAYRFEGNNALKMDELVPALKSKIGVVLNRKTVNEDVAEINKKYQEKGYIALVQSAGQADDGTLVFVLVEAKISKIEFTGLKKTSPGLVRRQIRTKSGDLFDNAKLQRDLNRLYDLNFFEQAPVFKVDDDPDTPGSVIVTFQFNERRTGQFSVGLGFDSRSKISGFLTLAENNLGGTGKRASASIEQGSRRNYELSYGDPYIGPKNASYDISIYQRSIFRQPNLLRNTGAASISSDATLEEQRTGGRFSFTQPLDDDRRQTIIYGYRNERAKLFQTDSKGNIQNVAGINFSGSGTVSAPSIGYLLDHRDLRIDPSRGFRFQTVVERGLSLLGGDTSFTKFDVDARQYIPLGGGLVNNQPRIVLAGRLVLGKSLNQLPTFEQYYIGGSDTVRGYNTDQQFGDNQTYGNVELRYRFQSKIQGVLFFDAGRAYGGRFASRRSVADPDNPGQTLKLSDSNQGLLTSIGIGVRLNTPLGPIRLDIGKGRDGVQTHFAFGPTF